MPLRATNDHERLTFIFCHNFSFGKLCPDIFWKRKSCLFWSFWNNFILCFGEAQVYIMCVRKLFFLFCLAIFFPFLFRPCFHVATIFNSSQILHICQNVQPRVWGAESPSSFVCEQKSTKWVFVLHGETCLFLFEFRRVSKTIWFSCQIDFYLFGRRIFPSIFLDYIINYDGQELTEIPDIHFQL